MELKEYLKIFKENQKTFWLAVAAVVVLALGYFWLQPVSYGALVTLNISRIGIQDSPDYKYDDFYRLQADEKFAETVAEWLKNPRMAEDIYKNAGIDTSDMSIRKLSGIFSPEKRSSQVVAVSFSESSPTVAKKVSDAIVAEISKQTSDLNKDQKESTWFEIIASEPVIIKNNVNFLIIFIASLALGIFIASWIILIIHYLK